MKDSQLFLSVVVMPRKYIKESNERFSTENRTVATIYKYIKESNERFSTPSGTYRAAC